MGGDNVTLISNNETTMEYNIKILKEAALGYGLNININKTYLAA